MAISTLANRGKVVLPIVLCCTIIVFGIFSRPDIIPHFINSDTLQPAQMAWEMTRNEHAVANFQWSRVPSFPDLAFFFAMEWLGVGWRWAFLLYTCLIAVTAILGLGWIVARMRGSSFADGAFWAGIGVTAALVTMLAGIEVAPGDKAQWAPQSFLFVCNFHGDAFLLSLLASCTALGALHHHRRQAWLTWALCALGTASDTIFLGYFMMPFTLATLLVVWRHRNAASPAAPALRPTLIFLVLTGLACLAGWIAKYPLPMQAMQLEFPRLTTAATNMLRDLPRQPWIIMMLVLTLALVARALFALRKTSELADCKPRDFDRDLLLFLGVGASLASLGLALVRFVDVDIYRYAIPFFWWPLVLGLGLLRVAPRRAVAAAAVLAALATAALPLSASALPRWHAPLEACLTAHRAEWGLKSGLATYWNSRISMVSSDWAMQVDQISDEGHAYKWGNNVLAYLHDMHAPQRPPEYNFIVVDEAMDPFELETLFGPPLRTEPCGDIQVMIFDQPIVPPGTADQPSSSLKIEFVP